MPASRVNTSEITDRPQRAGSAGAHIARLAFFAALLAGLAVLSLAIGSRQMSVHSIVLALWDPQESIEKALVLESRLPRALLAILAGAALGVAGLLSQSMTRNPLAEPGILGVNAGASLAIVIAVGFLGIQEYNHYIFFAFAGALLTAALVYLIGRPQRGAMDPSRLVLSGVAMGAIFSGLGTALSLVRPEAFDQLRAWTVGDLQGRNSGIVVPLLVCTVIGILIAASSARSLDALALGEDSARGLGIDIRRTRVLVLVAITLLAAAATSAVGAIGFLGLMAPHAARRVAGASTGWIMAYTALIAPSILLLADVLGRVLLPSELPAGVVCAAIGAPLLVAIARGRKPVAL